MSLQLTPPEAPIRLRSDKVKLARVVRNLVMNAIKFTAAGGVAVRSEIATDRGALISVSDTGIGIAPENLDRIFGEFAQLGAGTEDDKRGWGLGLAICRRLVAMMDGTISVDSTLNRGSTFTVRLPPACVVH